MQPHHDPTFDPFQRETIQVTLATSTRTSLGMLLEESAANGVVVASVVRGSSAAVAGVRRLDAVRAVGATAFPVSSVVEDVANALRQARERANGAPISITVERRSLRCLAHARAETDVWAAGATDARDFGELVAFLMHPPTGATQEDALACLRSFQRAMACVRRRLAASSSSNSASSTTTSAEADWSAQLERVAFQVLRVSKETEGVEGLAEAAKLVIDGALAGIERLPAQASVPDEYESGSEEDRDGGEDGDGVDDDDDDDANGNANDNERDSPDDLEKELARSFSAALKR